jgi:RNA polymerase sigma-70 factor (ECF subfamily)
MDKSEREKGFEILYDKYFHRIWKYVYAKLENREDTEDVVQEIFIKVWKGLPGFRGESSYYTWIFKIAMNTVNSFFRKKKIKFIPLELVDERRYSYSPPSYAPEKRKVLEKVKILPSELKEVIELYYISGFKIREISEILDIPEGTVKTRLKRARRLLMELIK